MSNRIGLQNVTKVSKYRSACIFTTTLICLCNQEKVLGSFETSVTTYQSTWGTSKKNWIFSNAAWRTSSFISKS